MAALVGRLTELLAVLAGHELVAADLVAIDVGVQDDASNGSSCSVATGANYIDETSVDRTSMAKFREFITSVNNDLLVSQVGACAGIMKLAKEGAGPCAAQSHHRNQHHEKRRREDSPEPEAIPFGSILKAWDLV